MNTSPGMTGHSLVPMSARAAGIELRGRCACSSCAGAALDCRPRGLPTHGRLTDGPARASATPTHRRCRPTCALMNVTATRCSRWSARSLLAAVRGALAGAASRCSRSRAHHASTATSTRNSVVDDPRQCGAAAGRQLLHARPGARRGARSSRCRGCARRSCSASGRTGCGAARGAPAGRRCGAATSGDRQAGQQLRRGVRGQPRRRRGRRPADACRARTAARRTCWRCIGGWRRCSRRSTRASRRCRCRRAAPGSASSTTAPRSSSAAAATTKWSRARAALRRAR